MANISTEQDKFYQTIKHFPDVSNGKLNIVKFVEASEDLIKVVDRFGTLFAPVKHDMQGNIDKIQKLYKYDDNSCLLELMLEEIAQHKRNAAEGILWLNRALLFFELIFREVITNLKANNIDMDMKNIFSLAYEGSVKKYHNWVTQQLFQFICRMSPSFPQVLEAFEADNDVQGYSLVLENYNSSLHLVRSKIDNFFSENDMG